MKSIKQLDKYIKVMYSRRKGVLIEELQIINEELKKLENDKKRRMTKWEQKIWEDQKQIGMLIENG